MNNLRKALLLSLVGISLTTLPGCTDDEVLGSIAVISVAAIALPDSRPIDRGEWRRDRDRRERERRERERRDERRDGRRDRRWDAQSSLAARFASPADFISNDARVIKIADKYEVSDYAATYIARALILAQQKYASGIQDIGLAKEDVAAIYDGKELAEPKVDAVSAKLALSKSETQRLLKEMTEDIQTEKSIRGM